MSYFIYHRKKRKKKKRKLHGSGNPAVDGTIENRRFLSSSSFNAKKKKLKKILCSAITEENKGDLSYASTT